MKPIILAAAALGGMGCAPALVEAPPLPLPVSSPPPLTAWHLEAMAMPIDRVSAERRQSSEDLYCAGTSVPAGNDSESGWSQMDAVEGHGDPLDFQSRPRLCIFYPKAGAPARSVVNPRRLPSGVLEGEAWSYLRGSKERDPAAAAFALPGGVFVIARNGAIPGARAKLSSVAAVPPPFSLAATLDGWTFSHVNADSLRWRIGKTTYDATRYPTRGGAVDAYRTLRRFYDAAGRGDRLWVDGTTTYTVSPD